MRLASQSRPLAAGGPERSDVLLGAAAVTAILAYLIHETYSLDVWWQVATGRDMLDRGALARVDIYRVAAEGRPYHDAHWLFQILLALAEKVGGMGAVQGITWLFWTPTLLLAYRGARRWVEPSWAIVLVTLVAMASVERFLPRPEIVTYFGIAAFWVLLQEGHDRTWGGRIAFMVIQTIWTACHGLFVIGPFLVGVYWLESAFKRIRGLPSEMPRWSLLMALVLLATLVSPFGFDGWRYALLMVIQVGGSWAPGVFDSLGELSPTFGAAARSGMAFWFYLALLVSSSVTALLAWSRSPIGWGRTLAIVGLALASFTGRRNTVLFAIAAGPFLAECLGSAFSAPRRAMPTPWKAGTVALMLGLAWYPLSGRYYLSMEIPARFGWGVTPSFFPHGLPDFLDRIDFRDEVLNSNTIGGFYLYHGFPKRRPLTDGCWVTVEPALLDWLHAASRDVVGWRDVMERFGLRGLVLAHTSPEAAAIVPTVAGDPRWRLVYYDAAASFWLPDDRGHLPPALDLSDPRTLPRLIRPEDGVILATFLQSVGASELLEGVLRETLATGLWDREILQRLGALLIAQERFDEAESNYGRLLDIDPRNGPALNEMAFLAYREGRLDEAMRLMERAVEVDPANASFRSNYERLRAASRVP